MVNAIFSYIAVLLKQYYYLKKRSPLGGTPHFWGPSSIWLIVRNLLLHFSNDVTAFFKNFFLQLKMPMYADDTTATATPSSKIKVVDLIVLEQIMNSTKSAVGLTSSTLSPDMSGLETGVYVDG